ncbi:MAG TPA: SIS domain-containing protein [Vitreimonas sp.]|uniref:SIS domain-containing protein n=1 Tax=Vitreimonas sp. TaxID=3069702 RepID=UPI002D4E5CA1|nr:SIS domain-containing protein [Vitreimonas sp.]HYD86752.1 SIS domain-containing protein [Vitreimonas sp.]
MQAPAARPGALMFAEAAAAPEAVTAQLAAGGFSALGERLRRLAPRLVATCARGSSDHAATFAKYLIETRVGVMTASLAPSVASLYRADTMLRDAVVLLISQSGASPDLIATAENAKCAGAFVLALVNTEGSPLAQVADETFSLAAGPERSVAATKSYIASLSALIGIVSHWSGDTTLQRAHREAPAVLREAWIQDWSGAAPVLAEAASLYVIARGLGLGAAGEAALKLKESCGLHAEAISAAEARHGPMALVRPGFPVLCLAQHDEASSSVADFARDAAARGANVFIAGANAPGATRLPTLEAHPALQPMLLIQSFYRLAHDVAVQRGRDADKPPHLSKVTKTL